LAARFRNSLKRLTLGQLRLDPVRRIHPVQSSTSSQLPADRDLITRPGPNHEWQVAKLGYLVVRRFARLGGSMRCDMEEQICIAAGKQVAIDSAPNLIAE